VAAYPDGFLAFFYLEFIDVGFFQQLDELFNLSNIHGDQVLPV
jgi:hypothetical protein